MLGSDPIHQYDSGLGGNHQRVVSLEPVYKGGGGDADWCRWYFDAFVHGAAMGYGYTQVGQENSFTWKRMATGFNIQIPLIARLQKEGEITVQTLGETGKWFRDRYPVTPPTSVSVLNDHSEKKQKTVWFNSRFYRANLLSDQGTMRFRDIHLFDETVASDYLTKRGDSSQCFYFTLPVVDGFNWSDPHTVAGLRLMALGGSEIKGGDPTVDDSNEGELTIRWPVDSPKGTLVIRFDEESATIWGEGGMKDNWFFELSSAKTAVLPFQHIEPRELSCIFKGSPYSVSAARGVFENKQGSGLKITPEENRIVLNFTMESSTD